MKKITMRKNEFHPYRDVVKKKSFCFYKIIYMSLILSVVYYFLFF